MTFAQLRLAEPILRALSNEGYSTPTPIQAQAIPHVLDGRDVLGCAQTGTGKTAAFALPILHRLAAEHVPHPNGARHRKIRCLVLSPTRELALQIDESFRTYGKQLHLRSAVIFGGVGQGAQTQALRAGVDVLVATPGRLLDLMNQGYVDLTGVETFVLDEADRMLDMGFIHDIRRIIPKLPPRRQNLLFSATMPPDIRQLANTILREPAVVQVAPVSATAERVRQFAYFVEKRDKPTLLAHYINSNAITRVLVFTRTKHGADRVVKQLSKGGIRAEAIHGNKAQNARQRALANFKSDNPPVLVATDIAARGIDVDDVSHVVNFDVPNVAETYVHRIGRTARAGASGVAVSFVDSEERSYLRDIERLTRQQIEVKTDVPQGVRSTAPRHGGDRPAGDRDTRDHSRGSRDGGRGASREPQRQQQNSRRQGRPQHDGGEHRPAQRNHQQQPAKRPQPKPHPLARPHGNGRSSQQQPGPAPMAMGMNHFRGKPARRRGGGFATSGGRRRP